MIWPDSYGVLRMLCEIGPEQTLEEFDFRSNLITHLGGLPDMGFFEFPNRLSGAMLAHSATLRHLKLPATPPTWEYSVIALLSVLEILELGHEERLSSELWRTRPYSDTSSGANGSGCKFLHLKTLICRHRGISGMLSTMLSVVEFPALERIELDGVDRVEDARGLPSILRALGLRAPRLVDISIDLSLKSVESTLSKKFGPHVIRQEEDDEGSSLNWAEWEEQPPSNRVVSVQDADLSPILKACTELRRFTVICPHPTPTSSVVFELTNSTLALIAVSGKSRGPHKLEVLSLDPSQTSPSGKITLEDLVSLAKFCPNLVTLEIGLNTSITHFVYASAMYLHGLQDVEPSNVTHINLGAPWVQSTAICAEFLRCIFPKLESVGVPTRASSDDIFDPSSGRVWAWNKVVKGVKELSAIGKGGNSASEANTKEVDAVVSSFNDDDEGYYYDSQEDDDGMDEDMDESD